LGLHVGLQADVIRRLWQVRQTPACRPRGPRYVRRIADNKEMRVLLAIVAMGTTVCAQDMLLARIKNRMGENLRRQPNYTCLETIERTRRPQGGKAKIEDTLRLEVALV